MDLQIHWCILRGREKIYKRIRHTNTHTHTHTHTHTTHPHPHPHPHTHTHTNTHTRPHTNMHAKCTSIEKLKVRRFWNWRNRTKYINFGFQPRRQLEWIFSNRRLRLWRYSRRICVSAVLVQCSLSMRTLSLRTTSLLQRFSSLLRISSLSPLL